LSHRTYRHVDTPVAYLGLTWRQWLLIVACAAVALGVIDLLHPPTPIALWLGTVLLTAPVAVSYFTSGGAVGFGRLVLDHLRWALAPRELPPAASVEPVRARGFMVSASPPARGRAGSAVRASSARARPSSADLLPLEALSVDGVGVLRSGALVRWLEVSPVNPLIQGTDGAEAISRAFNSIAARLPDDRQSLQLIAQATPLPVDAILAAEREDCDAAAEDARAQGWETLGVAIERLGLAQEQSIRTQSQTLAALDLRYFVVLPWQPAREGVGLRRAWRRQGPLTLSPSEYERAARESARHAEGVRGDLESIGLAARALDGDEIAKLIWARFAPSQADVGAPADLSVTLPATLDELAGVEDAVAHAAELRRALCPQPIDLRAKAVVRIGEHVEQARYVGSLPEQTWLGWLLYLMSAHHPFTLATHVHATDRTRERLFHKRRYRRIHGNNRGTEMKGRPLDPDQQAQEAEAADLNAELALTGAGIYRVSNYLAVREPAGDAEALIEMLDSIGRELAAANEAHLHPAVAAQRDVVASSMPTGHDAARRTRRYVSINVGDTIPLVGTRCGSPSGIPLGYSAVGRTLERVDLFDPAHSNHMLLVTGESGFGKTMIVNSIYARALARGDHGAVIERGGHYQFLASLIPGAANVSLGTGADAICPWDTPDSASAGAEKIDYLIALHATLIGSGRRDEYGLSALEENLLGRAIREVYERCALTRERPRELLLQETLTARAAAEAQAGAHQMADALRDLAARLHNFCGEGPYAYLADMETTVPHDAPLVVFDTRRIPAHFAGAAMFEIVEHVAERVARSAQRHLGEDGRADRSRPRRRAPRYYLTLEEVWKLLEHEATARWVNELPRRSRHDNLALIGVSQQLSDFNNPWGRAFIDNSARKLTFHQAPRQIEFLKEELGLTSDEVQAIAALKTVKRDYSTAYFDNGPRGRGTITARFADLEYWICTHEPEFDEPIRRQALRDAEEDPWRALRLLADPAWHHGLLQEAA
jgi:type IV secretory system conjugative DNA transfer VirD4/TraG family protein